jgi:hypothetical protein
MTTQNKIYTACGEELKIWNKTKGTNFELLCTLKYKDTLDETFIGTTQIEIDGVLNDDATQDSKYDADCLAKAYNRGHIRAFQPDFIYKDKVFGLCIVYDDFITIWDERDYSLLYEYKLSSSYTILNTVFDGKGKRIALNTTEGLKVIDIELKKELWKLDFKSISSMQSSECKNSQFFITMNSEDVNGGISDALVIFNFRFQKPIKIVKFPSVDFISFGKYVSLNNLDSPSICIITSKGFLQYINCMKRGESTFQTRMELIKKENSLSSPAITPMINFGDLDDDIEDFKLDQSKYYFITFRNQNINKD